MIKFNIPFTSGDEIADLKEVINRKKLSGDGEFSDKVKSHLLKEYNFENVFLTTSCTSAIELAALAIEFNDGDEIIIPSYTFPSTPSPFIINRCRVVFADSEKGYPNMSLASIKAKLSDKTKAIMVVHYGGISTNIEEIKELCDANSLILIEDAAQAIHSFHENTPLGSYGDFSVFSFHETKNINCGEGGMLVVNNKDYIEKIENIHQYGTNRASFLKKEIKNYEWVSLGLSFTLSEINAAFLHSQLLNVSEVTTKRQLLCNVYEEQLNPLKKESKLDFPSIPQTSNFHTFFILLKSPSLLKELKDYMQLNEVQCTTHYSPLHLSTYVKEHTQSTEELPNTEYFGSHLLRLPLFYDLTEKEALRISSLIVDFFE